MYIDSTGKRRSTVTETQVLGFYGKYRFFSNFVPVPIKYKGLVYPSVEHAYQAQKAKPSRRVEFTSLAVTAAKAKSMGRDYPKPKDWDDTKKQLMLKLLRIKFKQDPFKGKLLRTEDLHLEETNDWGDTYWGVIVTPRGVRVGDNMLGRLLMQVRSELKSDV